ncbi:unnamed protein product [Allacma fusca]|uniref:G-protein coupled receptors family 3 profile domain-containing protein n=1 Tax=Allacma fusca TaxID=39272 RepID=A0A8J2KVE3_9HEXA|nr:unnamed protein product [Allacma fusca]
MGVIERKNCGKSVGLCTLILIFSSVTLSVEHKLGQVEPLPKESGRNHKGAITSVTRRLTQQNASRDGLFGNKVNRNPSLFHQVSLKNSTTIRNNMRDGSARQPSSSINDTLMMMRDAKFSTPIEFGEDDERSSTTTLKSLSSSSFTGPTKRNISKFDDSWKPIRSSDVETSDFRNNMMAGFLKREVWTIPLLSIASLNIFLISLFEIYVLCKARGPSRRHLFLGQMLLFGLFLCSSLALVFAICPSAVSCFLGRLGLGIAYTLIFSVLMVKCVFLLSLDGGIYLPASYQACLLLFSVLVQVAIDTQWVIVYPPHLQVNQMGGPLWSQCGTTYSQLLLTLAYNVFLIGVVGILAFKTRGIRENYRESTYIGISILVTIPIWISWTIAGWILQGRHQDACVAFGLLAQSLATFLIMFMPKGRQLAAMGKEGMYLEDQEDQCSGYSPSFFHFKPSKNYKTALIGDALSNGHFYRFFNDYNAQFYYATSSADGNVYTTLEPTISTINPNVFFHRSDFHPGMIY